MEACCGDKWEPGYLELKEGRRHDEKQTRRKWDLGRKSLGRYLATQNQRGKLLGYLVHSDPCSISKDG
jgi:hypothetical protein